MSNRGRGSCPRCGEGYSNRAKPPSCPNCGHELGGKFEPKKAKSDSALPWFIFLSDDWQR